MLAIYDVPAPAKLNLFLHITGRRADGYHLLQSVFMLIDWHDTLHFELRANGQLSREDLTTPLPADDLVLRAARTLQTATGTAHGAHIGIAKRLPAQAGMGGGSSDAASTLLALNRLWGLKLALPALAEIGLGLGADVPFFLHGHNAWVEGIGEHITPVQVPPARFVVLKPEAGLETAAIFRDAALKRDTKTATITGFAADPFGFRGMDPGSEWNDLQPVAQRLCPGVAQGLQWLASKGLKNARMTGSGSAVFAQMLQDNVDLPEADFEADFLDAPGGFGIKICSNLAVHPLAGWANR